jgi:hypothetical protein
MLQFFYSCYKDKIWLRLFRNGFIYAISILPVQKSFYFLLYFFIACLIIALPEYLLVPEIKRQIIVVILLIHGNPVYN